MNAVFTLVKNEKVLLPIWMKYYAKWFEKVVVLNHQSTDGSVEEAKKQYTFDEIIVEGGNHDQNWICPLVKKVQKELLENYAVVVYAECDEFLIPNPYKYASLKEYIDIFPRQVVHARGFEPIQTDGEPPIKWDIPLLSQRKYWVRYTPYDKPIISRIPLDWAKGFHHLEGLDRWEINTKPYIDENLYLVHIPRIDMDLFKTRDLWRFKDDMSRFYQQFDDKEEIPEKFKKLL